MPLPFGSAPTKSGTGPITFEDFKSSMGSYSHPKVEYDIDIEALARKIMAAMKRGTLPDGLVIEGLSTQRLTVRMKRPERTYRYKHFSQAEADDNLKVLRWFDKNLPGGGMERVTLSGVSKTAKGFTPDRGSYMLYGKNAAGKHTSVSLEFYLPHKHVHYKASTRDLDAKGRPVWRCYQCQHRMPLREQRKRGLAL